MKELPGSLADVLDTRRLCVEDLKNLLGKELITIIVAPGMIDPSTIDDATLANLVRTAPRGAPVLLLPAADWIKEAAPSGPDDESRSDVNPASDIRLSPREQQVIQQIARGLTHGQIASILSISEHTVNTYVRRIRSKMNLGNKAQLTRAAMTQFGEN